MPQFEFLDIEVLKFGSYTLHLGNVISALLIILATVIFLMVIRRIIERPKKLIQTQIDNKRKHSIYLIVKYFVWVLSLLFVLEALGIQITIILAGSAALLVGIGLGLQNIFADLVSGLFLLFEGTIKIGDIIEVDNVVGRVIEINLRSSELMTRDGVTIIIPNSKFIIEKVVNWSHNTDSVRFLVDIGVAYGSDIDQVTQVLENCMNDEARIQKTPKSFIRFKNFGESSLDFQLIFWTKDAFAVEDLKSDLRKNIYRELTKNGITIPFPQRDVHIKTQLNRQETQA